MDQWTKRLPCISIQVRRFVQYASSISRGREKETREGHYFGVYFMLYYGECSESNAVEEHFNMYKEFQTLLIEHNSLSNM